MNSIQLNHIQLKLSTRLWVKRDHQQLRCKHLTYKWRFYMVSDDVFINFATLYTRNLHLRNTDTCYKRRQKRLKVQSTEFNSHIRPIATLKEKSLYYVIHYYSRGNTSVIKNIGEWVRYLWSIHLINSATESYAKNKPIRCSLSLGFEMTNQSQESNAY